MSSPRCQAALQGDAGFTLIEAIIAFALISVVILATGAMLFSAMNNNKNSYSRFTAATQAEQQMELLMTMPFDAVVTGTQTVNNANTGRPFITNWTVANVGGNANVKSISVTTTWTDDNAPTLNRTFTLNSVRYRN